MDTWAEARRLSRVEGLSGRAIAARLRISRTTVAKALAADQPRAYGPRAPRASMIDPHVEHITALVRQFPKMPATVIARRVGFNNGISTSTFRSRVAAIRAQYAIPDPVEKLHFEPGEQVQCDLWFPPAMVPDHGQVGRSFPVVVMVSAFSRLAVAVMIASRTTPDILCGMFTGLTHIGGVPKEVLWDNEAGLVQRRRPVQEFIAWAGSLGLGIRLARPGDPEAKGRVERFNQYLETSFLPGRTFTDHLDFNTQAHEWITTVANHRLIKSIAATPVARAKADRSAMTPLPAAAPNTTGQRTRVNRDYHVHLGGSQYWVHPQTIGKVLTITYDLTSVIITCAGRVVGQHTRRYGPGCLAADIEHTRAAKALRAAYTATAQQRAQPHSLTIEHRDLSVYDALTRHECTAS